jgi:hypothetical protein
MSSPRWPVTWRSKSGPAFDAEPGGAASPYPIISISIVRVIITAAVRSVASTSSR